MTTDDVMDEKDECGRIGGRGRTYRSMSARSGMQPTGTMALDIINNINVSLAGGASRARKLGAAARAGKAGLMTMQTGLSHCGREVTVRASTTLIRGR